VRRNASRRDTPIWRSGLFWLGVLYLVVGGSYAVVVPGLEKPDEAGHYGYVLYLREHRRLPPLIFEPGLRSEFKQPPLYYAVTALVTGWLPSDPPPETLLATNPYMDHSVPGVRNDNRNVFLHPPHLTPLLIAGRLVSLLLGLGTVVATYRLAVCFFPVRTLVPITAAALAGFHPKFLYVATALNNDTSVVLIGTVLLTVLVRRWKHGHTASFPIYAGVLLGLASIAKVSALAFFPLTGLALLLIHHGLKPAFIRDVCIIGSIALLLGGWWYARNAIVYSDPLTLGTHAESAASVAPLSERLIRDLFNIERTFWANYSRTFVSLTRLDRLLIWWGRVSLALVLVLVATWRKQAFVPASGGILLASWPASYLLLLVGYWTQKSAWAYGRLLFPAIAPTILLFVMAWRQATPHHLRRFALTMNVGGMIASSMLIPLLELVPLYQPWDDYDSLSVDSPANIVYTDPDTELPVARLIGYGISHDYAVPGTYLPVQLCWESLGRSDTPLAVFVQLLDLSPLSTHGEPALWGRRESYPGLGNLPTDRWPLQKSFCDKMLVWVYPEAPTPVGMSIEVGFLDPDTSDRLRATNDAGETLSLPVLTGVPILSPADDRGGSEPPQYVFDDAIGVSGIRTTCSQGQVVTVSVRLKALCSISYDATMFAHLSDADGRVLAQVDRQPLDGRYRTSFWLAGHVFTDTIVLQPANDTQALPASVSLGFYTWPSLQRLPARDSEGVPQPDDLLTVGLQACPGESTN
jgi:hypothetical protein